MQTNLLFAKTAPSAVQFNLAMIWDGRPLRDQDLEAAAKLRKSFPKIGVIHFISPNYFATGQDKDRNLEKIKSLVDYERDRVGIYFAPWQAITDLSEVFFRSSPTFWETTSNSCDDDCGLDVPLNIYSYGDLDKIIQTSKNLLEKSGLVIDKELFSIAGWIHSQQIAQIAVSHGYRFDFTPIAPSSIKADLEDYPIYNWTKKNWAEFDKITEPRSEGELEGKIIYIPQTLGAIDYITTRDINRKMKSIIKIQDKESSTIALLTINMSTAGMYSKRAEDMLNRIQVIVKENNLPLTFDWNSYRDRLVVQ